MDIELGIQNVARTVTFRTDASAEEVSAIITKALNDKQSIKLTDDKGRDVIVPANALGYAIVGSETKHAVGFGAM